MNDPLNDLFTLLPELLLLGTVLVVIVTDLFLPRGAKWILTPLMLFGLVLTGIGCVLVWGVNETVFDGFYVVDDLSVFFKLATVVIGFMAALFAPSYLVSRRLPLGEFNAILGFSLLGMFVLASSSDLITLFLGLELMVMPAYLLTGFHKTDRFSNEGGLKYFLLGSFASAILLFGISWTYGLTGTTRISEIGPALGQAGDLLPAALVAIALLTVGATLGPPAAPSSSAATMPDAVPRNARRNRLVRPVTTWRSRSSANSRTLRPSLPCSSAPVTRSNRRGSRRITGSSSASSSAAVFFTAFGAICPDTRSAAYACASAAMSTPSSARLSAARSSPRSSISCAAARRLTPSSHSMTSTCSVHSSSYTAGSVTEAPPLTARC